MGNMVIVAGRGGQSAPTGIERITVPSGRLTVPPAYMQTSGDAAVQSSVATGGMAFFGWTQEADFALSSFSVYLNTVTTPGIFSWNLSEADSNGDPIVGDDDPYGEITSGSSAGVWLRTTFVPVQLQRGKRYCLVFGVSGSCNVSYSARRQNPAIGSGHPPGCWSKTSTDGGTTWSDLQQDSRPALLNLVLNSTAHHSPQLYFGQYSGESVYLPGAGLRTIPPVGIPFDCESLTPDTLYNVYLWDNTGTLTLEAATTGRTMSEGIEIKSASPGGLYLGLIYPIERQSGFQAPIKVPDWMGVYNAYSRRTTFVGKPNPYSATTEGSGSDTNWVAISDFAAKFVTGEQCRLASDFGLASVNSTRLTILLDGVALPLVPIVWTTRTSDLVSVHAEFVLSEGCHTVCPAASGWPAFDYSLYDPIYGSSSLTGEIMA